MAFKKSTKKKASKSKAVFGKGVNTPIGRLVFPSVARATAFQDGNQPKYSAHLVVKPEGPAWDKFIAEVNAVGEKAWGSDWEELYTPIVDGADIVDKITAKLADGAQMSEQTAALYHNAVRILAKGAEDKPAPQCYIGKPAKGMLRRAGTEDDLRNIESQFYAGCYCRFHVTPFSFDTGSNQGVGLILKGIHFIADGDRLGAADVAGAFAEDFEDQESWKQDEVSSGFSAEDEDVDETNV